jgi:glycosyltransferase involved in cell wall biosynthesis
MWCKANNSPKTLLVYTASLQFMKAVHDIKKHYPNLTVCVIVADLPDMAGLSSKHGFFSKLIKKITASSYKMIDPVDGFVLLTKHMADYMKIKQPYCVMEGISTQKGEYQKIMAESDDIKRILYSGTLHKCFGVLNLVNAFKLIQDENYRLILCGIGDAESEIQAATVEDKRICYLGQISRSEVLRLQTQSTVVVNPRQNIEKFTKYSFPSKNLEYLSSGVPLVAYKLDGIPDEYDKYIFYVENNSIEALRNKLIEVCSKSEIDRNIYSKAVRLFVEEKNEINQTKKIVELLKKIET